MEMSRNEMSFATFVPPKKMKMRAQHIQMTKKERNTAKGSEKHIGKICCVES